MKKLHLIALFFILLLKNLYADKYACLYAANKYEKIYNLPTSLLMSVALTESGRKLSSGEFVSWPWTINNSGKGKFFKNKMEAVNHVKKLVRDGKKNIDLGCMQINYKYHPNAFINFENAFEPDVNVKWAAQFLNSLFNKFGSWKEAVGYYHSYRTSKRLKYSSKVFNTWIDIKDQEKYVKFTDLHPIETAKKIDTVEYKSQQRIKPLQNKTPLNKSKAINSPYIIARMEKVKFFRNYFKKFN